MHTPRQMDAVPARERAAPARSAGPAAPTRSAGPASRPRSTVLAAGGRAASRRAAVLALQRSAGNRATVAALQDAAAQRESRAHDERAAGEQVRGVLRGAGRPVQAAFRARAESFLGADLGHVRVHTGAGAAHSARLVGAHAYTSGSDIVFAPGRYDTVSAAGRRRLMHELTHVVQQRRGPVAGTAVAGGLSVSTPGDPFEREAERTAAAFTAGRAHGPTALAPTVAGAGGDATLQRDIGFEYQTKYLHCRRMKNGGAVPPDVQDLPLGTAKARWLEQVKNRSTRLPKGHPFLRHLGFTVEADDRSEDDSDCEIVTRHVPLTDSGVRTLVAVLDAVVAVERRLIAQGPGRNPAAAAVAGRGVGVADRSVFFVDSDPSHGFYGSAQMTMGLALRDIPTVVADLLADPGETAQQAASRRRKRAIVQSRPERTMNPGSPTPARGLVLGTVRARAAASAYRAGHPDAPVPSRSLIGLLTLIFAIPESVAIANRTFLKSFVDLLAKTDYVTLFRQLPEDEREYYRATEGMSLLHHESPRLVALVAAAPQYAPKMDEPLFNTRNRLDDEVAYGEPEWYKTLTLRKWLTAMSSGWNRLRLRDLLRTKNFPEIPTGKTMEGFSVLGDRMDEEPKTGEKLPVMELRSFNRMTKFEDARPGLLTLARYVRWVNEGRRS